MADVTTNLGKIAQAITATNGVAQLTTPPSQGDSSTKIPTTAWVNASVVQHGQCRLTLSSGSLKLVPYNGNKIIIAGAVQAIPSAGVSLAPTSLLLPATITNYANTGAIATYTTSTAHGFSVGDTVWVNGSASVGALSNSGTAYTVASVPTSTTFTLNQSGTSTGTISASGSCGRLYYVYAYMNSGTLTLEAVPVIHSTDAATGVEVKTGDSSRTLVGMCRTINSAGSPAFADSQTQRFVASWFNRQRKFLRGRAQITRRSRPARREKSRPRLGSSFCAGWTILST